MATARRWDHWKWVRRNPSIFLYKLVVNEHFLHLLHKKQVLQVEEKKWLMSMFLRGSDDDHGSRLKMVLLYTILTRHPDASRTYSVFLHALLKTEQLDILLELALLNTPPDDNEHDEQFTDAGVSQSEGEPFFSFSFDVPHEPLCIVDVIVDETMRIEIQESQESIRTWLSSKLDSIDPKYIEIRPHVARFPSTATKQRKLTIIFPHLHIEESDRQSHNSLSIEQLIPGGGVSNCHIELIPVGGLDYLFEPDSEDFLRGDFAGDTTFPTSRDTGTLAVFKEEDLAYDIKEDHLGSGTFSDVFRVNILSINRQAALKTSDSEQSFRRELCTFQQVDHHDNVIQLLGICIMVDKNALVLEYAENGDLEALITHRLTEHPAVQNDHEWTLRTKMALDVAHGMTTLHKKVVHLDLKTSNVLVGKGYCCKISDLGSSEFPNKSENSQFRKIEMDSIYTAAFIAPERFWATNHWVWKKQKADVFAYAMILLELKHLERPWQGETSAEVIKENIQANARPILKLDDGCPEYIVDLIRQCWDHTPDKRPDFSEIVRRLEILSKPKSPDSGCKKTAKWSSKRPFARRSHSTTDSTPLQDTRGAASSRDGTRGSPCIDSYFSRQRASRSLPHLVGVHPTPDVHSSPDAAHTFPVAPISGDFSRGSLLGGFGSLRAKATAKVLDNELRDVATEITGSWLEVATELDPSLFQLHNTLAAIQGDQRYPSPTAKAHYMLETWRGHYDAGATCTWLINALCRRNRRSEATKVFGQEIVNFICPQSQNQ